MSKARQRKLRELMQAAGLTPPPPEPPRIITVVPVSFFATDDEVPGQIAAYRAMIAASGYGVLVADPRIERVVMDDEHAAFGQFATAHQRWLTTDGAEVGVEAPHIVWERLRQQFRTWTPTSQAA